MATGAVELQVGTVVAVHGEPHRESPPCFEILQHDEVGQRFFRVEVVAVRRRERVAPLVEHFEPVLLAACADEGIAQVVDPRPRCRRDPAFERLEVVGCRIARVDVEHEVEACEHRLAEPDVPLVAPRAERIGEDLGDLQPHGCRVTVAGEEHHAGDEAPVDLAADEHADLAAFLQTQDAHRVREERVGADLEEVVARIGLEDRDEILLVVTRREEAGSLDDGRDLAPEQRYVDRVRVVRGRREQPEEPVFADDGAVLVEAPDAHVVEVGRPVDRRPPVGFREDEQVLLARRARISGGRSAKLRDGASGALRSNPRPEPGIGCSTSWSPSRVRS